MANRFFVQAHEEVTDIPKWMHRVVEFLSHIANALKYDGEEICVLFCLDGYIEQLNATYRKVEAATDVLSFVDGGSYEEDGVTWRNMGDIVISLDTLGRNAREYGVDEDEELKRLLVHGMLHLNGMTHGEEHIQAGVSPQCEMLVLQEKLLRDNADYKIMAS